MVNNRKYHFLFLHLALLLLLSLHTIAQECTLEDYLICPGIPEQDIGTKIELRVGIILQRSTLPLNPEASGVQAQTVPNDHANPNDRGVEYFRSSKFSQQVAKQMEGINSDPTILPDHHLCVLLAFYLTDCPGLSSADMYGLFASNNIFVAVNTLFDEELHAEHSHILANFYPVLSINSHFHESNDLATQVVEAFTEKLLVIGHGDNCPHIYDTVLEMMIRKIDLLVSVSSFATAMGWKRIGLLVDCQFSSGEIIEQWSVGRASLSFSCYEEGDFQGSFQNFQGQEIFIYVFLGELQSYLRFLLIVHHYGLVGERLFDDIFMVHTYNVGLEISSLCTCTSILKV